MDPTNNDDTKFILAQEPMGQPKWDLVNLKHSDTIVTEPTEQPNWDLVRHSDTIVTEPTRQPKRNLVRHGDTIPRRQPKRQRSDELEFSTDSDDGGVPLPEDMLPVQPQIPFNQPLPYSETIERTSNPGETSLCFTDADMDTSGSELLDVYNRIYPGAVSGEDFIPLSEPEFEELKPEPEPEPEPEPWSPPPPPEFPLSAEQDRIFRKILAGENTFFTGPAGSGKSLIVAHLKYAFDYPPTPKNFDKTGDKCMRNRTRYAVTAPTGIAAVLIGGSTVHSWSGVGLGRKGLGYYLSAFRPPPEDEKADPGVKPDPRVKPDPKVKPDPRVKPWLETDVLILDEVSMISPGLLELLNRIGKHVRKEPDKPFGGIQVICSGDFFQLPPVEPESSRTCASCGV